MITIKHEKKFTMTLLLFQISTGFSNWKDATMVLRKHEQSSSHRQYSIIISVLGVHGFLFYKLGMAFASFFCFLRAWLFHAAKYLYQVLSLQEICYDKNHAFFSL